MSIREIYNDIFDKRPGSCIIIYKKNDTNVLSHLVLNDIIKLRNIDVNDILYINYQEGYSIIRKEPNYAIDNIRGTIKESNYGNNNYKNYLEYLDTIYDKFGVENYED